MITTFAEGLLWTLIAIAATGIIVSVALIAALRKAELRTAELARRLDKAERRFLEAEEKIGDKLTVLTARLDRLEKAEENTGKVVDEIRLAVNDIMENNPVQPSPSSSDDNAPRPTLDAYNEAVHAFVTLASNIASMKNATTKPIIPVLLAALANYENGTAPARTIIRETALPDDTKPLMLNLVTEIENFHEHRRPVIDAWLAASPAQGIASYKDAVRMPMDMIFDPDLDEHILQDPFDGCRITYVHRLGFHFPGNTIHPFRQKSSVS